MNDPERLSEHMEDPVGRAALRAMRGDAASDDARRKTLAALGLTGGLAAGGGAKAAQVAVKAAAKASPWVLAKWGAGGAALVVLSLGGGALLAPTSEPPARSSAVVALHSAPVSIPGVAAPSAAPSPVVAASPAPLVASAPRPPEPRPLAALTPATAPPSEGETPSVERPGADAAGSAPAGSALQGGAVTPGAQAPASSGAPSLQLELAAIERARQRQSAGDPLGALRALDAYQAAFPQGRLGIEATVLRIEALIASGQAGAARDLGSRFLAAHPTNPLGPRVRSLLGLPSNSSGANP